VILSILEKKIKISYSLSQIFIYAAHVFLEYSLDYFAITQGCINSIIPPPRGGGTKFNLKNLGKEIQGKKDEKGGKKEKKRERIKEERMRERKGRGKKKKEERKK